MPQGHLQIWLFWELVVCLVPGQGPTWLGVGWAHEEALGGPEGQSVGHIEASVTWEEATDEAQRWLRSYYPQGSPTWCLRTCAGQLPSQMGSSSLGLAQGWEVRRLKEGTVGKEVC